MSRSEYPEGVTAMDHITHDMKTKRFPERSSIETFLAERQEAAARQPLGMSESPDVTAGSLGRFANWSDADCAAQCRMQSAEVLDPELSAFWLHLSRRLLELSDPGGRDA